MRLMSEETDAAWRAIDRALAQLPGWEAMRPSWHPEERVWHASAIYGRPMRRFDKRPAVDAQGATEAEALRGLAEALRKQSLVRVTP